MQPGNVQASLPWAWQGPAISQPALLTKTSVARVSPELVSSVFQQCLYLSFFPSKKLTLKAVLNHTIPGSMTFWVFVCTSGELALAWEVGWAGSAVHRGSVELGGLSRMILC